MGKFKDLTGMKFNRLTVIKRVENKGKYVCWLCKCDCGNEVRVVTADLKRGNTKSCGCLQKELNSKRAKEMWQNEEFREAHTKRMQNRWEDEEYRNKMENILIDEEFKNKQKERLNKRNVINWQNEEYRKAHSGENNPNYNPDLTDEEREQGRHIDGYKEWVYEVKERANFTCDCCGDNRGGNLVSHHLDGYHWNKEGRIDVNNGVCLCEKCHKEFHHIYGNKNNTKEQYIEFKERKQRSI